MIPEYLSPLANHLWQSTIVAGVVALLALVLRKNAARLRYWLWFTAAMKFLIPFSILVSIGHQFEWGTPPPVTQRPISTLTEISMPFDSMPVVSVARSGDLAVPRVNSIPVVLLSLWLCGFVVCICLWWRSWWRVRSALSTAVPVHLELPSSDISVRIMSSPTLLEPAIFGVFKPVLLLPNGIADWMTPDQLKAVLIHELCHIRRRDNLATAIYMVSESLLWFYPLVRWIGNRLIDERERACDEEVLRTGNEPLVYAEGILNVCKRYLESPLRCVSGVTGSDLKKRIRAILSGGIECNLNFAKKAVLTMAGITAIAAPVGIGVLNASFIRAQSAVLNWQGRPRPTFEVASVKPMDVSKMQRDHEGHQLDPERFVDRTNLLAYLVQAYGLQGFCTIKVAWGEDCPLISGNVPAWVKNERWEIQAKLPANSSSYTNRQISNNDTRDLNLMLQVLLEDRFHMKVHWETKELPVYVLTVGKTKPMFKKTPPGGELVKRADGSANEVHGARGFRIAPTPDGARRVKWNFQASSMQEAADAFSWDFDRRVLDRTGLKGDYDFVIEYDEVSDASTVSHPPAARGLTPSALSTALQAVGLKLESTKAPVEVLVIDHVERPSEN
jgi:bla regulator protein BlaR1